MAVVNGEIEAGLAVVASITPSVVKNFNRPESDVRRWPTISVQAERAPTLDGHPVLPTLWFRTTPVLSSEGEYVLGSRPRPSELDLGSDMRWLPEPGSWNVTSGTWSPWGSTDQVWSWSSAVLTRPVLGQVTYRIGREVLTMNKFDFSGGQHFTSNFLQGNASAVAFTISMVVMLSPAQTSRYALLESQSGDRTHLTVSEQLEFGWSNFSGTVDPVVPIAKVAPGFITMVVNPPFVDVYLSMGTGYTFRTTGSTTKEPPSTKISFFLGKSTTVLPGTFSLLDFNFWGNALTPEAVSTLNSQYTSAYGASSDRA